MKEIGDLHSAAPHFAAARLLLRVLRVLRVISKPPKPSKLKSPCDTPVIRQLEDPLFQCLPCPAKRASASSVVPKPPPNFAAEGRLSLRAEGRFAILLADRRTIGREGNVVANVTTIKPQRGVDSTDISSLLAVPEKGSR